MRLQTGPQQRGLGYLEMGAAIGAERHCPLAASERLVKLEAVVVQHPQIVVTVQIIGGEDRGAAPGDKRLVQPPQHAIDLADVAIIHRLVGANASERSISPAASSMRCPSTATIPKQMQRRGMVAGLGDDLPQDFFRLGEPARRLVLDGELHQLRDALVS